MLDLNTPAYPIATASLIANMNMATARKWVQNEWVKFSKHDAPAEVAGATARLSPRRILQLAIAARLVDEGMHPKTACKAALQFTDFSNPLEAPGHARQPGELFGGKARTVLCCYPDGSSVVMRVDSSTRFDQVLTPAGGQTRQARYGQAHVLELDGIVKHLDVSLKASSGGHVLG
ncbi:hypothetical protein IVB36_30225 [Bradyrhizobium sp. 35]|uniref:hypothetical protein n=1 Tax=Bradyrhizobium sp. 35 TaxID=2782670 RepID=UPI001FF8DF28|nr:hypothetical protein [Bradyrhizobium sp. 35]MCK1455031.1 hypothetical protein [Bradyrhizobium sp. 35]